MEREPTEIGDVINSMRNNVLESFGQKRDVLPVSRGVKTNEDVFNEFINLKGVDIHGHAFFEAGYIFACTQVLDLLDKGVLNDETWGEKLSTQEQPQSTKENGKNIPNGSSVDTKTDLQ